MDDEARPIGELVADLAFRSAQAGKDATLKALRKSGTSYEQAAEEGRLAALAVFTIDEETPAP